jgi:hypothetical protein
MDIEAVGPGARLDALTAAWAAAVSADAELGIGAETAVPPAAGRSGLPDTAGSATHPVATPDAAPESTATPADSADIGPQSGAAQTLGRPHAPVLEPLRPADASLPHSTFAGSEFAIPADQLVPATLTSLQVEGSAAWALLRQAPFRPLSRPAPGTQPEPRDPVPRHEPETGADSGHSDPDDPADETPAGPMPDDPTGWCEPLARALDAALAGAHAPHALHVAADQWRRGRCVVLSCPQGPAASGPAWAHVLWPLRRPAASRSLALHGLRVSARLTWSRSPEPGLWRHVRVVKEHHPRRGRQLVAMGTGGVALPCEVQLGPVLARPPRPADVVLRIDAVRGFWAALGTQWSASVLVCAHALVPAPDPTIVEAR